MIFIAAWVFAGTFSGAEGQVQFIDVTRRAGIDWSHENGATPEKYLIETMGGGGAFLDYDKDGWLDIYLVDSGSHLHSRVHSAAHNALYRNNGDGTFVEVTATAGLGDPGYGMGVAVGDFDNDGWSDIYVTRFGRNTLYRNLGDGTFADVTESAGVAVNAWSTSAAFFDMDNDGDLDLFVCLYLDWDYDKEMYCGQPKEGYRSYCHPHRFQPVSSVLFRNNGDGTFEDVTAKAGVDLPGKALGVVTGDVNGDGFADIYVANDAVANFLFSNNGDGTFEEIGLIAGVALGIYGRPESGMGVDLGDYNEDGRMDLIVTNIDREMNNLFANQENEWFLDLTLEAGLGQVATPYSGFGVRLLDYDNDGDLDLVVLNGHVMDNIQLFRSDVTFAEPPLLLQNSGGNFFEVGKESGEIWQRPMVGRALAAGDYDNDGDSDLLFVNNGQPAVLLQNEGGNRNAWLGLELVGKQSNRDAVGAVLTLKTNRGQRVRERNGGTSYQAAQDPRIVFGLAEGEEMISLEIRWPSGVVQRLEQLELRRYHTIQEATEEP
ncbi:MAG: CRTAC1 family protein [Acidobacteria bacterium]|nr:CRTAC1 family protein [Acidobacteriota bacterium]